MASVIRCWRTWLAVGFALCVSGCAAVRSYDTELHGTLDRAAAGNVEGAIKLLDSANPDKNAHSCSSLPK